MHFANPIPLWLALLAAAAIGGIALFSYRRPLVPLTPMQRAVLIALRARSLNAMLLGEEAAANLGVDVGRERLVLLGLGSLVTAAA